MQVLQVEGSSRTLDKQLQGVTAELVTAHQEHADTVREQPQYVAA